MVTINTTPINIVYGQSISVVPLNQAIGYGTIACVIYNTTIAILQATHSGGISYIQPNSATAVPAITGVYPVVTPITNVPIQFPAEIYYVGTITTTFYDINDGWPEGFPQPLIPFSGASILVVGNVPTVAAGFWAVTPSGTTSLTINVISGSGTLIIDGASGANYHNAGVVTGQQIVIQVPAANNETQFLFVEAGGSAVLTVYAAG